MTSGILRAFHWNEEMTHSRKQTEEAKLNDFQLGCNGECGNNYPPSSFRLFCFVYAFISVQFRNQILSLNAWNLHVTVCSALCGPTDRTKLTFSLHAAYTYASTHTRALNRFSKYFPCSALETGIRLAAGSDLRKLSNTVEIRQTSWTFCTKRFRF